MQFINFRHFDFYCIVIWYMYIVSISDFVSHKKICMQRFSVVRDKFLACAWQKNPVRNKASWHLEICCRCLRKLVWDRNFCCERSQLFETSLLQSWDKLQDDSRRFCLETSQNTRQVREWLNTYLFQEL